MRAHRGVQHHPVAERGGEFDRHQLGAADEAQFLGAVRGLGEAFQGAGVGRVAGGGDVEEDEQEGEFAGFGREDRRAGHVEEELGRRDHGVGAQPGLEGLPVPLVGLRGGPGGVDRDLLGQVVERGLHDRGVGEAGRVDGRDRAEECRRWRRGSSCRPCGGGSRRCCRSRRSATPSESARALMRSWVGPMNSPPPSVTPPFASVQARRPGRPRGRGPPGRRRTCRRPPGRGRR